MKLTDLKKAKLFRFGAVFFVFLTSSLRYVYPDFYIIFDILFVLCIFSLEKISEIIGKLEGWDGRDNY